MTKFWVNKLPPANLLQAPMAGVTTPTLAAAVSNAGALGALGLGAATPHAARQAILETKALTNRPFHVNFFCHAPADRNYSQEQAWIERSRPQFELFGSAPPKSLSEIYQPFSQSEEMLEVVLETRPAVVSFHFGLPSSEQIRALKEAGCCLMATATSLQEAQEIEAQGLDAVIAQGWSAGGHRGIFDPDADDDELDTKALTLLLVRETNLPVIAAGGLMDGYDIHRAMEWGAVGAQLGTAFVACPESAADDAYRAHLQSGADTVMTRAISGRPARCLVNQFTEWASDISQEEIPAYPCTYDLGKALNKAARSRGESGYGAQWAGGGASRVRVLPAAELVAILTQEWKIARANRNVHKD